MATRTQTVHTQTERVVEAPGEHTLPLAKESLEWVEQLKTLDARLSMPILKTPSLGRLEYVLSLPGSMFGVPLYSLIVLPYTVAAVAEVCAGVPDGCAVSIAAVVLAIATLFWAFCMVESVSNAPNSDDNGVMRAFHPLGKKLGTVMTMFGPHTTVWVMGYSSSTARNAAAYYITVYYVTQVVVELVKTLAKRARPVIKVKEELQTVSRKIPQIQHFLSREHAMHSSFPSGDAAGSTTFALLGLAVTPPEYRLLALPIWAFFPALSTFARVYFHAHFLGDVFTGHALAAAVALAFLTRPALVGTPYEFSWFAMCLWEIPVVLGWAFCQQLKPKSAENIYNAENLVNTLSFRKKSA